MIAFLKRHIFQILALAGTALVFELMGRGVTFLLFLGSLVLLVAKKKLEMIKLLLHFLVV